MSVADIFLRCERCDLAGFVTGAPLNVAYIIDGLEVPMHVVLGYCPDCDSLGRIMECFNRNDSPVDEELQAARATYQADASKLWYRWFSKSHIQKLEEHIRELEVQQKALEMRQKLMTERKGSERCIRCGSPNVSSFAGMYFLPFDEKEGFFTGEQRTDFIHPGCGGEVIAKGSEMRVMYRVQTFRFHANGDRIQDDEES